MSEQMTFRDLTPEITERLVGEWLAAPVDEGNVGTPGASCDCPVARAVAQTLRIVNTLRVRLFVRAVDQWGLLRKSGTPIPARVARDLWAQAAEAAA